MNQDKDTVVCGPIVSTTKTLDGVRHYHCFKVCHPDVLELRVIKEIVIEEIKKRGFPTKDKDGWFE